MDASASSVLSSPFRHVPQGHYFFHNGTHDEALARMRYLVSNGQRFGLLLGNTGSGKTTILHRFAADLNGNGKQAIVCELLGRENHEFLFQLAAALHSFPESQHTLHDLWRMIEERLRENEYQNRATVLLLDDADEAEMDVLTSITRLVLSNTALTSHLSVITSAHSSRSQLLGPRLRDMCELRIELDRWTRAETERYLSECLHRAGQPDDLFESSAIDRIHALSGGVPRHLRALAEFSLLAVASLDHLEGGINADCVEAAYAELSTRESSHA